LILIDGILAKNNEINHLKALFPNCRSPLLEKILKENSEKSEISQEHNFCCYISLHNAEKDFVIIIKTVTNSNCNSQRCRGLAMRGNTAANMRALRDRKHGAKCEKASATIMRR
jgi:hypothetical protein